MACGDYSRPIEYWLNWQFVDGAVCTFGDQIGVGLTMLMFFGVTFLVLYQATDSPLPPVAAMIVLAPAVRALIPAIGLQFMVVVVVLALTAVAAILFMSLGR